MKSNMMKSLLVFCVLFAVSASASSFLDMTPHEYDDVEREVFVQENHSFAPELPKGAYRNELGQLVFKTLPIAHSILLSSNPPMMGQIGDFVDVNGDGLPDFIVAYYEWTNNDQYYRATFLNQGDHTWVMAECESNHDFSHNKFPPCQ